MGKFVLFLMVAISCFAWGGYDLKTGECVEIGKGNLVRCGRDIEIYDCKDGKYKIVNVKSISKVGDSVEIEVYDYEKNKIRILEMESR
ncbi:DUF5334 family protein [Campylobacter concisus]|uniref:DUF5334 family protein n=1 Tax=Campylobacter concisus TaxID=199 RepID=UPI000D31A906|nr:DUF5334 family protein [Campylobacter concisus]